jgi:rubrerythrin
MADEQASGTRDTTFDLISALYHAAQGATASQTYARDAKAASDPDLAEFFQLAQQQNQQLADRAKKLLAQRLGTDGNA